MLSNSGLFLSLLLLHQVIVCKTHVLPQLHQFWDKFQSNLADKNSYKTSINGMKLRFQELKKKDDLAKKIKAEKLKSWKESDKLFHHQSLPPILEIIRIKLIS